nr:putative transposase (putative), gypsy type [Tanacetum cinerariifolium]
MVAHTIDTVASVLTQRELDHFYNTYNIPANLRPELPGRKDTIKDAPVGKIWIYTRFLEFANFRVPLSRFLLSVLEYYQINFLSFLSLVPPRGFGDKEVVVGESVVVTSSSLEMLTNSCLGGIMVSLIFLEGLDEEALVEFMIELFKDDDEKSKDYGLFN